MLMTGDGFSNFFDCGSSVTTEKTISPIFSNTKQLNLLRMVVHYADNVI